MQNLSILRRIFESVSQPRHLPFGLLTHAQPFGKLSSRINRTLRCESCSCVVEEYCNHDLAEYYVTTHSEELHCVVSPDFLRKHIVDDIPNDPYCTPGFITAFRMLSPQYEPVFGAPARTMSGALAEMERLIGDALYSGYVGYNGRAPGVAARKEEGGSAKEGQERRREGGDARHILVAYFEIKELASILGVDWRISNLAIRIFRFTASNTSLRNRSVESLATAAFVAAVQHKCREGATGADATNGTPTGREPEWLTRLRKLSVHDISQAANMDVCEVQRNLKVVNTALRKQRPDSYESIVAQMPDVCNKLSLTDQTQRLAVDIAKLTIRQGICSRRAPASVSAACIFMACRLDNVRKTQIEVSRATAVTEVTLRKVHKELTKEENKIIPEWFLKILETKNKGKLARPSAIDRAHHMVPNPANGAPASSERALPLPPLPPGFMQPQQSQPMPVGATVPGPAGVSVSVPISEGMHATTQSLQPSNVSVSAPANLAAAGVSVSIAPHLEPPPIPNGAAPNPVAMLSNLNNPGQLQALASALANNPAALQMVVSAMRMMPPPPPPLPPKLPERAAPASNGSAASNAQQQPPSSGDRVQEPPKK